MEDEKLTRQQQKALYKWFTLLAQELNNAGLDQRKVLKPSISIPWAKKSIHDQIWIPIQDSIYGTDSTTELLKREQIDKICETIMRFLSERFGFESPDFPSIEQILFQLRVKEGKYETGVFY